MAGTGRAAYSAVLRVPGAAAFSAAGLVGRMPISMLGIGAVLLVEDQRGSYALAGVVSAAFALGLAVLGPLVARLVDAHGQGRVLLPCLAAHVAGVLALVLLAVGSAPAATLVVAAVVAGGALPPLGSCVRARWAHVLAREERTDDSATAFAWEAVVDEVVFVLGPLLVVAVAGLVDPVAGLLLAASLCAAGTLVLVAQPRTAPPAHAASGPAASVARGSGLRLLVGSLVGVGLVFGSVEVVMVAFAEDRGGGARAGVLLALVALGSAGAGLAYGARSWQSSLDRRYLLALAGLGVGVLPLLAAPSVVLMAPAALLAGISISPTLIGAYGLVEQLVPPRARTEGFTWLNSGLGVGVAAGAALGGLVADAASPRVAFLVCAGGAALALATGAAGRRHLRPVPTSQDLPSTGWGPSTPRSGT